MESIEDVLIPVVAIVVLFGGAFGCLYFWLRTRNQQRLALLEKGLDRDIFAMEPGASRIRRWAALLIGIGVGVLAGHAATRALGMEAWVAYVACISLASGIALIVTMKTGPTSEAG